MIKQMLFSAVVMTATLPIMAQNTSIWSTDAKPSVKVSEEHEKMQTGKFAPTYESLSQYQVPEWFCDVKFGFLPWQVFGEGPITNSVVKMNDQGFNEGSYTKAKADEIRFTQTPKYIYATALGWPEERKVVIRSLASGNKYHQKSINNVTLLGYGKVKTQQTADGLVINLPKTNTNTIAI